MNHGESVALTSIVVFVHGSFLLCERLHTLFPSSPFYHLPHSLLALLMKCAFKIKTEPVTQAAIIFAVVAFSSGSLATVAIYTQSLPVSIICSVVLAIVIYLALRFSPR
jgi:hypothetical protein